MSNYTVYTGFWVDHSHPVPLGATLTVPIRWGNYLIAALSSLVAWAATNAWKLCAFYMHQRYAAKTDKDVLDQQLQVLLRGPNTVADAVVEAVGLHAAWRRRVPRLRAGRRILPLVLLFGTVGVLFAAAGIFVADVASKTYQDVLVPVVPLACGDLHFVWNQDMHAPDRAEMMDAQITNMIDWFRFARSYTLAHYGNISKARFKAEFPVEKLPFVAAESPCPFDADGTTRCLGPDLEMGPAWSMDSGLLDSHVHFGMNARPADRVQWRKLATCAVVDPANYTTEPFTEIEESDGVPVNHTYVALNITTGAREGAFNMTMKFNVNARYDGFGYQIRRKFFKAHDRNTGWGSGRSPIAAFNRTDADIGTYVVSSNQVQYSKPVRDPLFHATRKEWDAEFQVDRFMPTNLFGLLVCYDSFQICNPINGRCGDVSGTMDLERFDEQDLGLNPTQRATAWRLQRISWLGAQLGQMAGQGPFGLLASELGPEIDGRDLPDNQWTLEVSLWFAATLTAMQNAALEWARKPWPDPHPPASAYISEPALQSRYRDLGLMGEFEALCKSQLVRSEEPVQNFGVLATALVIIVALAIVVVGMTLPCCVEAHRGGRRKRGALSPVAARKDLARRADDRFQLLRMALEDAGIRGWEEGLWGVPVLGREVKVERLRVAEPVMDDVLVRYPSDGVRSSRSFSSSDEKKPIPVVEVRDEKCKK